MQGPESAVKEWIYSIRLYNRQVVWKLLVEDMNPLLIWKWGLCVEMTHLTSRIGTTIGSAGSNDLDILARDLAN
jgi:hypothetical protein